MPNIASHFEVIRQELINFLAKRTSLYTVQRPECSPAGYAAIIREGIAVNDKTSLGVRSGLGPEMAA